MEPRRIASIFEAFPAVLKSYCRMHTRVHVHVFGWRRLDKGPPVNVCVRFQRNPKVGVTSVSVLSGEGHDWHRNGREVADVEVPVFIRDVQSVNIEKVLAETSDSALIVHSLVRLQPLNLCSGQRTQRFLISLQSSVGMTRPFLGPFR